MLKKSLIVVLLCALVASYKPEARAQVSVTIQTCGVVTLFVPATALTPGAITIGLVPYVIAPGTTLAGQADAQVGAHMCLSATVNAALQITSGSLILDVNTQINICGIVDAYVAATANAAGYIRIGGVTYPIAAGTTLDGAANIQVGAEVGLQATVNALGQITVGVVVAGCGGTNTNHAPTITAPDSASVVVGQTFTTAITAADQDAGDTLSLTATGLPAGATMSPNPASGNPATAQLSFTPSAGQAGQTFSVVLRATDTHASAASATLNITVTSGGGGGNHPPSISAPSSASVAVGQTLTATISAADQDAGDTITLSASGLPSGAAFVPATGSFTFTPTAGQAGQTYTVTFTATDNHGGATSATTTITVTAAGGGNHAPTISVPGPQTATVGVPLTFLVTASDPDPGDVVTLSASGLPAGATFIAGVFLFTPSAAQAGQTFTVTFTANDTHGGSTSATVVITVSGGGGGTNHAPTIAVPGSQTTAPGQNVAFTVTASDSDGDTVTLSASNLPTGASFNASTGRFSFTPSAAQAGQTFTVIFTAADDEGASVSAGVLITVTGNGGGGDDNHAPVLSVPGALTVAAGSTVGFTVAASDPDGDPIVLSAIGVPINASFNASTGLFSFTPSAAQAGQLFTVVFTATDALGAVATGTVVITVTESTGGGGDPEPPVIVYPPSPTSVAVDETLTFVVTATTQAENCAITLSATGLPANSSFNPATGQFVFEPVESQANQSYTVTFRATDCFGQTATGTVTIVVTEAGGGGEGDNGQICLSASKIVFAPQAVGASCGYVIVTVTNNGTGTLTLSNFAMADGTNFRLDGTSAPMSVAPGSVAELKLQFIPTSEGVKRDTLRMVTSDETRQTVMIRLKGKARPR